MGMGFDPNAMAMMYQNMMKSGLFDPNVADFQTWAV